MKTVNDPTIFSEFDIQEFAVRIYECLIEYHLINIKISSHSISWLNLINFYVYYEPREARIAGTLIDSSRCRIQKYLKFKTIQGSKERSKDLHILRIESSTYYDMHQASDN